MIWPERRHERSAPTASVLDYEVPERLGDAVIVDGSYETVVRPHADIYRLT